MRFVELNDDQWEFIKPHIPQQPIVGRKRADDRKTINGILYVLITGCRWHDMPRCYGSHQTAWRRLKWWSKEGVWTKILAAAQEHAYKIGKLNLEIVAVDSTLIDSNRHAWLGTHEHENALWHEGILKDINRMQERLHRYALGPFSYQKRWRIRKVQRP